MLDEPAVGTYAGTAEVSQEFINFVADLRSAQQFDSTTTALLCREAYELGRKEGGVCSTRETVAAILAVMATLVLLGVHLVVRGL
jgi:hypothetical protein